MSVSWLQHWAPTLVGAASLAVSVPVLVRLNANGARPRFVLVLCLVAIAVAAHELTELATARIATHVQVLLGFPLGSAVATGAAAADALVCLFAGWGLWQLRSWARTLAMVYLGYVLVSFLVWGARGLTAGGNDFLTVAAWQMLVLPFVTFSLMYLHGGARYFGVEKPKAEKNTDWLY